MSEKEYILKNEYKSEFPLVSVLILTYNNVKFLKSALESVFNQTYKNIEIIIGDDSSNDEVENLVKKYIAQYRNIKYINNEGKLGGYGKNNRINLYKESRGEFISFLNHDDIYEVNRIEIMVSAFLKNKSITLVTSGKKCINSNGEIISESAFRDSKNIIIDGKDAGKKLLYDMSNFIGEPTTAMFKKKCIEDELTNYNNEHIYALGDVTMWLKVLKKGKLLFIPQNLSSFRIHEGQNSNLGIINTLYAIDWYKLINSAFFEKNYIEEYEEYIYLKTIWRKRFLKFIKDVNLELNLDVDIINLNSDIEKIIEGKI